MYYVGRTGTGKTTALRRMILQDLAAGHGLAVVAPEAEMIADELLPFIPKSRWDDVVFVDPSDIHLPVSFNPLHLDEGEDLDLKSAELMAILQRWAEDNATAAPRMETILRQALYALLPIPNTTLLDIEPLLDRQDDGFRRGSSTRPGTRTLGTSGATSIPAYPKDAHLALVNRLGRFLQAQDDAQAALPAGRPAQRPAGDGRAAGSCSSTSPTASSASRTRSSSASSSWRSCRSPR